MEHIAIKLDPAQLANADLDIRYDLPALLAERSGGLISNNGYDYAAGKLVLFLKTANLEKALGCLLDVVANVQVLDNDLRAAVVVAVKQDDKYRIVYPPNSQAEF